MPLTRPPAIRVVPVLLLAAASAAAPAAPCRAQVPARVQEAEFVLVPAGEYVQGTNPDRKGARTQERRRRVIITRPFYLQATEVTQAQWRAVMRTSPSQFPECGDTCPVENVSWDETQEFIRRLNAQPGGMRYRLPTEAEWEYAARAGTDTEYPWGDEPDCARANVGNGGASQECAGSAPGRTAPVGSFPPNPWGLRDMHGNVLEWVEDAYTEHRPGFDVVDPLEHSTSTDPAKDMVLKGGYWGGQAESARSPARARNDANSGWGWEGQGVLGFRLVREVAPGSAEDVRVPEEVVGSVPRHPDNAWVLTGREPWEVVFRAPNLKSHTLRPQGPEGVWIHHRTGQEYAFSAAWDEPPEVVAAGDEVRIAYAATLAQVQVEVTWPIGALPVRTEDLPDGRKVAVVPMMDLQGRRDLDARVTVTVRASANSYFELGWRYHYEFTFE